MRVMTSCVILTEQIKPQHILGDDSLDNDEEPPKKGDENLTLCDSQPHFDTADTDYLLRHFVLPCCVRLLL